MADLIQFSALLCAGLGTGAALATFNRIPRARLWTETLDAGRYLERGAAAMRPEWSPRCMILTAFNEGRRLTYIFRAWGVK